MRRAFTLIEVLIVVAIMAMMVSVAAVSVRSGQDAARVKGAARDLMAAIRQARSMALVMMQPTVITYSTKRIDGEICAQVSVEGAKLLSASSSDTVETLSGEIVRRDGSPVDGQAAAELSRRRSRARRRRSPRSGKRAESRWRTSSSLPYLTTW